MGQKRRNQALTSERCELFLVALAECGNLGQAASEASPNAVGDCSATFRDRRRADPAFDAAIEDALEAFRDRIRQEAYRRGIAGVPVDIRDAHGVVIGSRLVTSDRVLLELMRGRLREHQPVKRVESTVHQRVTRERSKPLGLEQLSPENQDKLLEILESEQARNNGSSPNVPTAAKPTPPLKEHER